MLRLLAILILSLLSAHAATAAPLTGRTLKTWIEDAKSLDGQTLPRPPFHAGMLNGYLIGLADGLMLSRSICPPPQLPFKTLLELVEKHLEHDYAGRDLPAAPRLQQLLRQTYPCARPERKTTKPADGQAI